MNYVVAPRKGLKFTRAGTHLFCVVSHIDQEESDDDIAAAKLKGNSRKQTRNFQVDVEIDEATKANVKGLGLEFVPQAAKTEACTIASILSDSPLRHTDLSNGDVIYQINGVYGALPSLAASPLSNQPGGM
jgi:C-terminal processing protease CtpA/Prc